MLNDRISFEIGAGVRSAGNEFTYYIASPIYHRLNPCTGLFGAIEFGNFSMFYLPVGISYFGKKNFQYSAAILKNTQ